MEIADPEVRDRTFSTHTVNRGLAYVQQLRNFSRCECPIIRFNSSVQLVRWCFHVQLSLLRASGPVAVYGIGTPHGYSLHGTCHQSK